MYEVELSRQSSALIDLFKNEYQSRYGTAPIIPIFGNNQEALKNLIQSVGFERAKIMITQFLKTDGHGDWYVKQGHSLDCFLKNTNAISAGLQTNERPQQNMGQALRLQIIRNCDIPTCDTRFTWFGTPDEIQARCLCPEHK